MAVVNALDTVTETHDSAQLRDTGFKRLRASEDPQSVRRDLSKQGLPTPEIQSLFEVAARQQRRSGLATTVGGALLSLIIFFIVWGATDAGLTCSGPGLLVGLMVMVRGILKLKKAGEIARAGATPSSLR